MTSVSPSPKASIALAAVTDEDIAPDLPSLMERVARARKFLFAEREYIKLILLGGFFIFSGSIFSQTFPWHMYAVFIVIITPWLYGWLASPGYRLANAFRNETMPYLLRDYGRWNYALGGSHFSREELRQTGILEPNARLDITSIITGERQGVALQMASLVAFPHPRFGFYYRGGPMFKGWVANIRLPDLPQMRMLLLPQGIKPPSPQMAGWTPAGIGNTYTLWVPPGQRAELPPLLTERLVPLMQEEVGLRFALYNGVLWALFPGELAGFNLVSSFNVRVNEPEIYQKARLLLASMFTKVDRILWPSLS